MVLGLGFDVAVWRSSDVRDQLALRFEVLLPHLNERQRRLLLAAEARLLGHGGVRAVAQVAGVSESTVREGVSSWRRARIRSSMAVRDGRAGA
jgi:hypothetical protein